MTNASDALPSDLAAAHAMILAERAARVEAEAAAARERATNSSTDALIGQPKLKIEKRRHELYGTFGAQGRNSRPDMQLEDLGADATEDDLAAEASAPSTSVVIFQPKRPTRRPLSPPPKNCAPRGSLKMVKLREDVTGTLGVIQRL